MMPEKLLLRAPNWIGDTIMMLPALGALRRHCPDTRIDVMALSWTSELLENHPDLDRLIPFDPGWNLTQKALFFRKIRHERYPMGVLFAGSLRAALFFGSAGVRKRIGYDTDHRRWLLNVPVKRPADYRSRHHQYYFLRILEEGLGLTEGAASSAPTTRGRGEQRPYNDRTGEVHRTGEACLAPTAPRIYLLEDELAAARDRLENARITVIGAVEEEADSKGARYLARTMDAPDFTVIGEPSDWESITLGYKGRLCVDYYWEQPDSHSAGEQTGPAEKAITFWNQLMDYAEQRNRGREGHFDTLDPALREFTTASDGLVTSVKMNVAMRLPPDFKPEVLKRKMKAWAEGGQLIYSPLDMPFKGGKNNLLVRAMLKGIRATGGKPRFKLKTGTSDMNTVGPVWNCPIIAYGPGDSALDHTPEEHIDVDEFRRAIDVLARALEKLDS